MDPAILQSDLEKTAGMRTGRWQPHAVLFWQFVRFGVVGAAATVVGVGLLVLFVERFGLHPVPGIALAFCIAVIVSYVGNLVWTFRVSGAHTERVPKFVAVQLVGLLANMAIMFAVYDVLHLHYLVAVGLSILLVPPMVFVLNRSWTFG